MIQPTERMLNYVAMELMERMGRDCHEVTYGQCYTYAIHALAAVQVAEETDRG